jgi:anti-sigma factor (TIGR02949 family)
VTHEHDHGDELTCAELVMLVTEYLDGALSPEDRARFQEHADACPDCGDHLEQMRITIAAAGRLREEQVPAPARAALLDAFRDWKRGAAGESP